MRVAFVHPSFESLGIECLSAYLQEHGHETRLFFDPRLFADPFIQNRYLNKFFKFTDRIISRIFSYHPGLIAFSVYADTFQWAIDLADKIKRRCNIPIVFGGIHPTTVPEQVLENNCVDFVIRGEGEYPLMELVNAIEGSGETETILNLCFRKKGAVKINPLMPLIKNLDELPFPDKELYYRENSLFKYGYLTSTSRGCKYKCSFCYPHVLMRIYGVDGETYYRRRSVSHVIKEINHAKSSYGIKFIRFNDDTFNFDEGWLEEFSQRFPEEVGIPFWCFVSPMDTNPKVVDLLKKAGCFEVEMGVQAIDVSLRYQVMRRPEALEKAREGIALFKEKKIRISTDNLIGLPGENMGDMEEIVEFYLENRPHRVNSFWLTYFPGTDVLEYAKKNNIISPARVEVINRGINIITPWQGGSSFQREKARIQTLMLFINILPKKVMYFLLRGRLYRFLPFLGHSITYFLHYGLSYLTMGSKNDLWARRTPLRYIKYMFRKIFMFIWGL